LLQLHELHVPMYAPSDNSIQRNEHARPGHASEDQAERADVYSRMQNAETPIREHDLKHTFGRRLRAAGVSFEDRQELLGHKRGRITTHYFPAELSNLIVAAEKVASQSPAKIPATTGLRRRSTAVSL
jgi:integrase